MIHQNYLSIPGCEATIPAVGASSNSGVIEKLQNECVEGNASSTVASEFSTPDTTVGDELVKKVLSAEQSYSTPVKNPFEGKSWSHCWVNPYAVVEEEKPLIEIDGERLATRGGLVLVKGEEKVGKSTFMYYLESCLFSRKHGNISTPQEDLKILNCDTEQSVFHITMGVKRVMDICKREDVEVTTDRFFNFELRSEDMDMRFGIIQDIMENTYPDVLVIDNLADLIDDYNNIKDSRRLISQLVQMAEQYKCVVILVVHTTKEKSHALGTLGGDGVKKAEAILSITNNGRGVINCSVKTRNKPIAPFSITLDEKGLPVPCGYVAPVKKQRSAEEKSVQKQDEAKARVEEFVTLLGLKTGTVYDYKMQAKLYSEKSGQSYKTGTRRIDEGVAIGSLELWDEYGFKKFRLNSTSANTSLPF